MLMPSAYCCRPLRVLHPPTAVAPGVKLISLDVFGSGGGAEWADVIAAVNWAIANQRKYNITSINMSLGAGASPG